MEVGRYTYGNISIYACYPFGRVRIVNYTSIASVEVIISCSHHVDITTYPFKIKRYGKFFKEDLKHLRDVEIGIDVWIGHGVTLLEGVRVSDGAVLGAKSVVRGFVHPYSVLIGNPATVVRRRFSEDEVQLLLDSRWWKLDMDSLSKIEDYLYTKHVKGFVEDVREVRRSRDQREGG